MVWPVFPPPPQHPQKQSMWFKRVFMKYSAAFVAPVSSKPDPNAYSGQCFLQREMHWTNFQFILNKWRRGPVLGLLQNEGQVHTHTRAGSTGRIKGESNLLLPGSGVLKRVWSISLEKWESDQQEIKLGSIEEGGGIIMTSAFLILMGSMFSSFRSDYKQLFLQSFLCLCLGPW